ncbi:MAG TPA: hypothetical protein PLG20_08340 [Candidatus Syntrophosphaera sp.]|nr:hypothetical protein [Candidatus Syntrophosphaera sp.]
MTRDLLLAQILAQIPDCPNYLASAYLLEFIERLRGDGKQTLVDITDLTHQDYAANITSNVISVQKVFANGLEMGVGLTESDAVYLLYTYPTDTDLTTEAGEVLTTEDGEELAY